MALRVPVRRNYGGKLPVSIKCNNLHSFKEGVILLCQRIRETIRMSHLHRSVLFTIPLKNISKVYERVMFKQTRSMEKEFSCGFRNGCSLQECLIALIEKWKSATDKEKSFGALLTDLSNVFDYLPHELSIAQLHVYDFSLAALRFVQSYLSNNLTENKGKK